MKKVVTVAILFLLVSCAGMKKAQEFYDQKNYQAAIDECQRAVKKDSTNAEAYVIMGKAYRATNNLDKAVQSFQAAYHIQPKTRTTDQARTEIITTKLQIADQALTKKNYNTALSVYKEVLEMDSTNFRANYQLAVAYEQNNWLAKAKYYYQRAGKIDTSARDIPKKVAEIDRVTNLAEKYFQKGKKYYLKKKYVSAVRQLKKAIALKDDFQEAKYYYHIAQGKILYRKGKKSQLWDAIDHFGKAMIIHPEKAEPHFYMAQAYEKKDRNEFSNAIDEYKIALEKEPSGPLAKICKRKIRELTARRDKLRKFWGK